jgi:hypothetical protein
VLGVKKIGPRFTDQHSALAFHPTLRKNLSTHENLDALVRRCRRPDAEHKVFHTFIQAPDAPRCSRWSDGRWLAVGRRLPSVIIARDRQFPFSDRCFFTAVFHGDNRSGPAPGDVLDNESGNNEACRFGGEEHVEPPRYSGDFSFPARQMVSDGGWRT